MQFDAQLVHRVEPAVYQIFERSTRYFRVMTRADRTPALVNEVI